MKKIIIILFTVFVFMQDALAQCPMCKASVESNQATMSSKTDTLLVGGHYIVSGTQYKSVGMGLNGGILMLLAAVYFILFSVGIMWYRKYRKNQMTDNA